ncbi:hypothetical protein NUSPORA_00901 [Nucleospora cyclopteri]
MTIIYIIFAEVLGTKNMDKVKVNIKNLCTNATNDEACGVIFEDNTSLLTEINVDEPFEHIINDCLNEQSFFEIFLNDFNNNQLPYDLYYDKNKNLSVLSDGEIHENIDVTNTANQKTYETNNCLVSEVGWIEDEKKFTANQSEKKIEMDSNFQEISQDWVEEKNIDEHGNNNYTNIIQLLNLSIALSQKQIDLMVNLEITNQEMKEITYELNTCLKLQLDMQTKYCNQPGIKNENTIPISSNIEIFNNTSSSINNYIEPQLDQCKQHLDISNNLPCYDENDSSKYKIDCVFNENEIKNIDYLNSQMNANKNKKNSVNEQENHVLEPIKLYLPSKKQNPVIMNSSNELEKSKNITTDSSKILFIDLTSDENEKIIFKDTDEDEDKEYKLEIDACVDNVKLDLHKSNKLFRLHKPANTISFLTVDLNFIHHRWVDNKHYKNDFSLVPSELVFVPGWHLHNMLPKNISLMKKQPEKLLSICRNYGLIKYYDLIVFMIKTNTYSKNNKNISLMILFHLICLNFCKSYNLGKGKDVEVNTKLSFYKLIHLENYKKIFQTKEYWYEKAEILFQKSKNIAKSEFELLNSSFTSKHLFNVLHFLKHKNHIKVSLAYYVYYSNFFNSIECLNTSEDCKFIDLKKLKDTKKKSFILVQECKYFIQLTRQKYYRYFENCVQ